MFGGPLQAGRTDAVFAEAPAYSVILAAIAAYWVSGHVLNRLAGPDPLFPLFAALGIWRYLLPVLLDGRTVSVFYAKDSLLTYPPSWIRALPPVFGVAEAVLLALTVSALAPADSLAWTCMFGLIGLVFMADIANYNLTHVRRLFEALEVRAAGTEERVSPVRHTLARNALDATLTACIVGPVCYGLAWPAITVVTGREGVQAVDDALAWVASRTLGREIMRFFAGYALWRVPGALWASGSFLWATSFALRSSPPASREQ